MQNNCLKNSFLHREIDKSLKIYVESLCKTRFFFMFSSSKMYFLAPITISIPKSFRQSRKTKQNEFCDWHPFPHCVFYWTSWLNQKRNCRRSHSLTKQKCHVHWQQMSLLHIISFFSNQKSFVPIIFQFYYEEKYPTYLKNFKVKKDLELRTVF